jgi:gamma-glutamyl:cysteine ligase YbdK (ATP-grasp superfamily)
MVEVRVMNAQSRIRDVTPLVALIQCSDDRARLRSPGTRLKCPARLARALAA